MIIVLDENEKPQKGRPQNDDEKKQEEKADHPNATENQTGFPVVPLPHQWMVFIMWFCSFHAAGGISETDQIKSTDLDDNTIAETLNPLQIAWQHLGFGLVEKLTKENEKLKSELESRTKEKSNNMLVQIMKNQNQLLAFEKNIQNNIRIRLFIPVISCAVVEPNTVNR